MEGLGSGNQGEPDAAISGRFPAISWRPDPGGQVRTIEEAVEIARRNGVMISDDVAFFVDEKGELGPTITARTSGVRRPAGGKVRWSDLVNDRTG
jgi:hypothetical protein